ncbi:hypothetical protein BC332_14461 [Capsicum chinense]|nr:hypothetical protein BC332_14461 [Capsicum chinense]
MERGKGKEANSSSVSSAVIRKDIAKIFDFIEKLNDEGVQIPFQIEKLASELTFVSAFFLRYYYLDSEGRNGESMSFLSIAIHDLAQSLFRWSGVHMLIKLKHHDILQLLENITSYISSHSYAESSHMTMTEDRLAELLDVIVMYLRSKNRNDPTILKKLRLFASAKGKKPAIAISKEKRKEVVKRDPLPKILSIKLCRPHLVDNRQRLPLDDFDDFTTLSPLGLLTKLKARSDTSLAPHSKRRKTDDERKESMTGQEKIKAHPSIKEVNESPSGTSNSNVDQARHEPSLMDFCKQTPPAVESVCASTQKINVSRGTNHEEVLLKVDMNAIESLVKTYVDKRFDDIEALMKKHHEEMKKQHEEMMLAVKEYHDAPQKVVIDIDSSHRVVEKNEKDGNDLRTPNEQPNDISEKNDDGNAGSTGDHKRDEKLSTESSLKLNFDDPAIPTETIEVQNESETDVTNIAFQHSIDNTIAEIFSPVSAIQSDDLLQKGNLLDLILPTDNIEVRNESHVSSTEISSDAFQELIDNIIAGMYTSVVAMTLNSNDLAEKVNLPDPFL